MIILKPKLMQESYKMNGKNLKNGRNMENETKH